MLEISGRRNINTTLIIITTIINRKVIVLKDMKYFTRVYNFLSRYYEYLRIDILQ